jgi:RimJ/RimL family protein N-acetyltransferase
MFFESLITPRLPAEFEDRLDDGTAVLTRPVRREDAQRLRAGFERLSHLARRRRFLIDTADLSDEQLMKLVDVDQHDHAAWGCLDLARPEEPGIGVARYQRINGDPRSADVSITVLDEYQGRGAGLLLHACLHLTAHRAGIKRFYYDVLSDHERYIRQLKALGARFEGRASNIDRLSMPVYHRAWDVPTDEACGRRLAERFIEISRR